MRLSPLAVPGEQQRHWQPLPACGHGPDGRRPGDGDALLPAPGQLASKESGTTVPP